MKRENESKRVALSGLLAAVTILFLYLAVILPFHLFFFTFLSSFSIALLYQYSHGSKGILFFMCTVLLSLFLFPHPRLIPYLLFFGHYGLAKIYLEERGGRYLVLFKLLYFNLFLILGLTLLRSLLLPFLPTISLSLLILILQPCFLLYDYFFSRALRLSALRLEGVL